MPHRTHSTSHQEYLAALDGAKRAALERLSEVVRAAAPKAEESVSYGLPAFRLDGKVLVMLGATAQHCAFYPGSGTAVEAYRGELGGFSTSKGTIRFSPDQPLPDDLVRRIVNYRIAENAGQVQSQGRPRK